MLALALANASAPGDAYLVKDINTSPDPNTHSSPREFVKVGGLTYFSADDGALGRELWRTDGTAAGTQLVRDIFPGEDSSDPLSLAAFGNELFFLARDPAGCALWRSDGTAEGTSAVRYFDRCHLWFQHGLTAIGDTLFFAASDGEHGMELWKSDGTKQGTELLKDIRLGTEGSYPDTFTELDGTVYFVAGSEFIRDELWATDGTGEGTVLQEEFAPGLDPGWIMSLTVVGQSIFLISHRIFYDDWGKTSSALWRKAPSGRMDLVQALPAASAVILPQLTYVDGWLYFRWRDDGGTLSLWKSNGTPEGTSVVHSADQAPCLVDYSFPWSLTAIDGGVLFTTCSRETGVELWMSDGTPSGTVPLRDINQGPAGSDPTDLTIANGNAFFTADDGIHGRELWVHDASGQTRLVKDIAPPECGRDCSESCALRCRPRSMRAIDGQLYFAAENGASGMELWRSDGSEAGTALIRDINDSSSRTKGLLPEPPHSRDDLWIGVLEEEAFFKVPSGIAVSGLWRTDGTEQGTLRLAPIRPQRGFPADGVFLLSAEAENGRSLWRTDGTVYGTEALLELPSGPPPAYVRIGDQIFLTAGGLWKVDARGNDPMLLKEGWAAILAPLNDELLFAADGGLWITDGRPEATLRIAEVSAAAVGKFGLRSAGREILAFSGNDGVFGSELWLTDGTTERTKMLKDIRRGTGSSSPFGFAALGDLLYFSADDGISGRELWRTDGTAAGTQLVKDTYPGPFGAVRNIVALDDILVFVANDGQSGDELWRSDGTEAGTRLIRDVVPGPRWGVGDDGLTAHRNQVFFAPPEQNQLWVSDGTEAGTRQITNVILQRQGDESEKFGFTSTEAGLFFQGFDPEHGYEPWVTDGTEAGTRIVADVAAGPASSDIIRPVQRLGTEYFMAAGERVFFFANDRIHGHELWAAPIAASRQCPADCDQSGTVTVDELVVAVNIALGTRAPEVCMPADMNEDGAVTVAELVSAVSAALRGCWVPNS